MTLPALIVRIATNQQVRTPLLTADSAIIPTFFRAVPLKIQVAEFNGTPAEGTLVDVTGNTLATLTIRRNYPDGEKLIQKTSAVNTSLIYSHWAIGTGQHYEFVISAADINIELPSSGRLQIHGLISATTPSGELVLGQFLGYIETSGITTDEIEEAVTPTSKFAVVNGVLLINNPDQDVMQAVFPTGEDGEESVAVG